MDVPPISPHRLELVPLSPALIEAVLEGRRAEAAASLGAAIPGAWPDADDERFLRRPAQLRRDPNAQRWLVRALVRREPERVMAGHARFHGEPGGSGAGEAAGARGHWSDALLTSCESPLVGCSLTRSGQTSNTARTALPP